MDPKDLMKKHDKIVPYIKLIDEFKERMSPVSVQLNITNSCACKCIMCKKHEWKLGHIGLDDVKGMINDFEVMGVESVVFSGGDPLAYLNFAEVVEYASAAGLKIGILTAGNIKFDDWDRIVPHAEWIRFSIDALDKDKWMEIRGSTEKRYEFLSENIKKILELIPDIEERKRKIRINCCILDGVNEQEILKLQNYADTLGFDFMAHDTRVFEEYMKENEHHTSLPQKCIIPFVHCVIEVDGMVYPCCTVMNENAAYEDVNHGYALGNVSKFRWDFKSFWNHSDTAYKRKFFYEHRVAECKTCPARYYCCNVAYEAEKGKVAFL